MFKNFFCAGLFATTVLLSSAAIADDARVVVLEWSGEDVNFESGTVQRIVESRIARSDVVFVPSVDLYQNGRRNPSRTTPVAAQVGSVPESNVAGVVSEIARVASIQWDDLDEAGWAEEAQDLVGLVDYIWFVDRPELREPLFRLYAQIGRAAWNQGNQSPPFFEAIGGQSVNYYHYLAATMAAEDASLLGVLGDPDLESYISQYLQQLNSGAFPTYKLDFELDNNFDLDDFSSKYTVLLNGLEVVPDNSGQVEIPLGRVDIALVTADGGMGLADSLVVDKLEDRAYFVLDVARKSMGEDLVDALMLHPNECTPELERNMSVDLAIYAALHPASEFYVAVPEDGNPNKTLIWRYDRPTHSLQKVGGGDSSFPVRFAAVSAVGVNYNSAALSFDVDAVEVAGGNVGNVADLDLSAAYVPANFEFRAHFSRFMAAVGFEFGYKDAWSERFYGDGTDSNGDGDLDFILESTTLNRHSYVSLGYLLGRDAGVGLGPRLALRFGTVDIPDAFQTSAHFGWSQVAPTGEYDGRVRPFIDADLRVGMLSPREGSLQLEDGGGSQLFFGLTAGIGCTF